MFTIKVIAMVCAAFTLLGLAQLALVYKPIMQAIIVHMPARPAHKILLVAVSCLFTGLFFVSDGLCGRPGTFFRNYIQGLIAGAQSRGHAKFVAALEAAARELETLT
jgi:hypothetical protein